MSEQWKIGSEVNAEDYTQCAIYCNQLGDRHIERQNDAYLVVANPITSQITIATGNNENTGDSMEYLFGDGSDGNVTLTTDTSYDRMKNFSNFTLNAGVNLTKTTAGSPLIIRCTGTCTINGTINLAGKGMAGGGPGSNGYGYGNANSGQNTLGGVGLTNRSPSGNIDLNAVELAVASLDFDAIPFCGGGGAGAYAYASSSTGAVTNTNYGGIGAGCGGNGQAAAYISSNSHTTASVSGGNGGGGLLIIARTIIFAGSLIATGNNGTGQNNASSGSSFGGSSYYARGSGGGGGGGCAVCVGNEVNLTGTMNFAGGASGGSYTNVAGGAGGTGGYVKLII